MLFLSFLLIPTVEEKWLSMCNRNFHNCFYGKLANHRDEYGLEIPTNFQSLHFHGTEKAIKLVKKVK